MATQFTFGQHQTSTKGNLKCRYYSQTQPRLTPCPSHVPTKNLIHKLLLTNFPRLNITICFSLRKLVKVAPQPLSRNQSCIACKRFNLTLEKKNLSKHYFSKLNFHNLVELSTLFLASEKPMTHTYTHTSTHTCKLMRLYVKAHVSSHKRVYIHGSASVCVCVLCVYVSA